MQESELDLSELDEVLAQWKKDREDRREKRREELRASLDLSRAYEIFERKLNKNREV